jgi:uncharacterized membrane protein YqjE
VSQPSPPRGAVSTAPQPSPAAVATPTPPGPTAVPVAPTAASGQRRRSTPQRLRMLSSGVILAGLIFGVVGALVFSYFAFSLSRAEASARQLIRVQKIQTDLLTADATATNAFLIGGLERPAQRATYDQVIGEASALIAESARAQSADGAALSALNDEVVRYAGTVEQARANNRQGLPVGAQYMRIASTDLRTVALPILANLVEANTARANQAMEVRGLAVAFAILGLAVLAGLLLAVMWVAKTFKRWLNVGLVAASLVVLVAFVGGTIGLATTSGHVSELRSGSLTRLTQVSQARIEANNAKSNESLTLIARGSGAAFEQVWQSSAGQVQDNLDRSQNPDLSKLWGNYTNVHSSIRELDDGGKWDQAVSQATGSGKDSANARFAAFDTAATAFIDEMAGLTRDGLAGPRIGLVIGAVLIFLAGIGAAVLGRRGVAARLREYR